MLKYLKIQAIILLNVFLFIDWTVSAQQITSRVLPCIEFRNRQCIKCPEKTHLREQQCYQNIEGCKQYHYGTSSASCKDTLRQVQIGNSSSSTLTTKNVSFFSTTTTNSSSTLRFSTSLGINEDIYQQIFSSEAQKDVQFGLCNNFMRRGEYGHFISRSQNPVQSIFYYISNGVKQFKILYEGSGGNLLVSLIAINIQSKIIVLRSFVTIGRTSIINGCIDYSLRTQCTRCEDGYHLDSKGQNQKICVQNIPGCVQYYGNICVKCRGYQYLIQNRCVSDCDSLMDGRSIIFYGNSDLRKLSAVKLQISRMYF